MFNENKHQTKLRIDVEICLNDGANYFGKLSVAPNQRPSDLMNDERQFLPFEISDGQTIILRKSTISKVLQLDQHVETAKRSDPYEILGVSRNISDADLTKAYRSVCAQNHPDKLQASGMSAPFMHLANSRMVRINDAYRRIMEARQQLETANAE